MTHDLGLADATNISYFTATHFSATCAHDPQSSTAASGGRHAALP
jgi:hypothetical protein